MKYNQQLNFLLLTAVTLKLWSCSPQNTELIADFEPNTLEGWERTGDLTPVSHETGRLPENVTGFSGNGVLNTGHEQPEKTGTLTSPEFTITKKYINFLITGNCKYNAEKNCNVRIVINGKVAKYAPPTRYPLVEWGAMDVGEFIGEKARFQVYDNSQKHFLLIDQVYQGNELALGINQQSFLVDKKYLLFPVKKGGIQYRFRLEKQDDITEQFVVEMSEGEPDYWAFKDLSNYQGKQINLISYSPTQVMGFERIKLSDKVPGEEQFYQEKERPQFHFTSKTGRLNDPNGLVYNGGIWHMMYQHIPYGIIKSLKHWGHATSTDLIHWKEKPSSVVPDDLGSNHSGGAVVDFNNSAGLQEGGNKTLLAYWTSAGHFTTPSSHFRQCVSYSTDKGETWKKYAGNPIIGFMEGRNRDPNVIWHPQAQKWIMSLFLDNQEYVLFNSDNLLDWTLTDRIEMPASECPDLFQLDLDGDPEKRKWVFWGGNGNYVVGEFDGQEFDMEGEAHRTHYGTYYAAMTYNNAPNGRVVQVGWLKKWPFPHTNYRMQLSISNEITLKTSPAGYPALYSYPVEELEVLRADSLVLKNIPITQQPFIPDFEAELLDINLVAQIKTGSILKMKVRGEEITYNKKENTLSYQKHKVELLTQGDIQEFRILVDRASIEIFCNAGEKALFCDAAIDTENQSIEFSTSNGKAVFKELKIHSLKSAWGE